MEKQDGNKSCRRVGLVCAKTMCSCFIYISRLIMSLAPLLWTRFNCLKTMELMLDWIRTQQAASLIYPN
jgi:hypothetical protein